MPTAVAQPVVAAQLVRTEPVEVAEPVAVLVAVAEEVAVLVAVLVADPQPDREGVFEFVVEAVWLTDTVLVFEPVVVEGGEVHTRVHYLIHVDLKGWIPTALVNSSLSVSALPALSTLFLLWLPQCSHSSLPFILLSLSSLPRPLN